MPSRGRLAALLQISTAAMIVMKNTVGAGRTIYPALPRLVYWTMIPANSVHVYGLSDGDAITVYGPATGGRTGPTQFTDRPSNAYNLTQAEQVADSNGEWTWTHQVPVIGIRIDDTAVIEAETNTQNALQAAYTAKRRARALLRSWKPKLKLAKDVKAVSEKLFSEATRLVSVESEVRSKWHSDAERRDLQRGELPKGPPPDLVEDPDGEIRIGIPVR
ncbi:MAG: hypothetical protein M1825_005099 [Sarcosagium campestre]|nr:MAG: hypothetical protein M1825_005099 [Sarcosagium campestre]